MQGDRRNGFAPASVRIETQWRRVYLFPCGDKQRLCARTALENLNGDFAAGRRQEDRKTASTAKPADISGITLFFGYLGIIRHQRHTMTVTVEIPDAVTRQVRILSAAESTTPCGLSVLVEGATAGTSFREVVVSELLDPPPSETCRTSCGAWLRYRQRHDF